MKKIFKHDNGFITYRTYGCNLKISIVWVNRSARNQGHGSKMLKEFIDKFKNFNIRCEIWVDDNNYRLLKFYKELGFNVSRKTKNSNIFIANREISNNNVLIC